MGTFTIRARDGKWSWANCWGDFTLTEILHRGKPVYRNSKDCYLYTTENGAWAVGNSVGYSWPLYRSTDQAPSPDLCQNWEYSEYDGERKYNHGDISVICFPL